MLEWDGEEKSRSKFRRPASIIILIPITVMFMNIVVYYLKTDIQEKASLDSSTNTGRRKLLMEAGNDEGNCTNPAVLDFPQFIMPGGRLGHLILPFVASVYLYILLARVCDSYFIASIKVICAKIGFSGDVAGATLMAAATSSPELFVNMVGTFVTGGNIGVGTIIGSAVFNILAVPGLCSFFAASKVIQLDWWPLTRDSISCCISLLILCLVLEDGTVQWYEALIMVISYGCYLIMMHYNNIVRRKFDSWFNTNNNKSTNFISWEDPVAWPLLRSKEANGHANYNGCERGENEAQNSDEDIEASRNGCCWAPNSTIICKMWWLFTLPISFILACTIPDCKKWPRLYMITFSVCVCWIAVGSYLVSWMITISGYVLRIPDSVMGLTFIAAGMCIPETISSIIVSKQGQGSMALANALGSNVFDTLFCFGLPWLIKTTYLMEGSSNNHSLEIDAARLEYDTLILLITLVILFTIVSVNKFQLTKIGGYSCLLMYLIFIGFSVGIELHAYFISDSLPLCNINL